MKKAIVFLSLLLFVVTSCKKGTVDVSDLLTTVPSSAGGVVILNLENLIEDTGSKIKDHEIIPGKELEQCMEKMTNLNRKDLEIFFDGRTGIDPKAAVLFYDSNRAFITFVLYDENKFCEFVESQANGKFEETASGVKVLGNTAMKGTQAWICLTNGKTLDSDAIASYANLKSSQSFLVTEMGERLLTEENDIRGWVLLGAYLDSMLDRSQRIMFTMGAGFLFENAESVAFKADFKKGELKAEAEILNDKYKPAKYQLPMDKVDVATLKKLGDTCDGLMAFTINPELVKKFEKIGTSFGGSLFGDIGQALKNVDGTVGVIANGDNKSVAGIVTTTGDISQELKDMISENMGAVSIDGKYLQFKKGEVTGSLNVSECAEALKGSCLGMVFDSASLKSMDSEAAPKGFKFGVIKMSPESGGVEFEVEAKTANPKENALLTLIKGEVGL